MKKGIKIIAIFSALFIAFSCQKEYSVFDESKIEGIYPYINGSPTSIFFFAGQGASSYKAPMGLSGPTTPQQLDVYVVVGTKETHVKTITLPADTYEVTLQEAATALGQPLSAYPAGSQFVFRNKITSTDGQVWSAANSSHISGGLLSGTAYQNLYSDVTVFVTCPFVADDAVGDYTVVQDDWVDYFPGDPMTVDKVDATHIIINEYPGTYGNNHAGLVITVDPATGTATVEKKLNNNGGYGATDVLQTAGSGFVLSCVGYIKVTLNFTYNGGAYNGYTLIISK